MGEESVSKVRRKDRGMYKLNELALCLRDAGYSLEEVDNVLTTVIPCDSISQRLITTEELIDAIEWDDSDGVGTENNRAGD